jgi:hypothetical protein
MRFEKTLAGRGAWFGVLLGGIGAFFVLWSLKNAPMLLPEQRTEKGIAHLAATLNSIARTLKALPVTLVREEEIKRSEPRPAGPK